MRLRMFLFVLTVSFLLPGLVSGAESLTLISGGKANCVIVTNTDPKQGKGPEGELSLWQNVLDFQRILEKMSGAKIPVVGPGQAAGDGVKIYVGSVPLPKKITIDEKGIGPRGYCIVAAENALVLRGKTEGGTTNALYGFLQDKLGVRWFFPSELFEVVPVRETVSIPYGREKHNPAFEYGIFMTTSGLSNAGEIWCEQMRRDAGAFRLRADPHYLGYILNSDIYGKTHPEYYPLLNGKRVIPAPGDRSAPQPCLSNPGLVQAVVDFCRKSFDENPNALNVAIGRNDSTEWCECDNCKAMDFLPLEKVNGMEQHSDRYFAFANQVAREITKSHPGKLVGCLVYNDTFMVPKNIGQIEPNIAIALCVDDSQYYDKAYQAIDYATLSAWKEKGCKYVIVYNYPALCWWWAPRYYPHQNSAHMKEMYKQGVVGWYGGLGGHWPTQGPLNYLTARLMWDIDLDSDKVLDDFFMGAFGPEAGQEIKAYYTVFEKAWMRLTPGRTGKYFEGWSSMREQMVPYRISDLDEALTHLNRARELAKDEIIRKRVAYIADNFSYAANAMRGWLTSDVIDKLNKGDITSPGKAKEAREMLLAVSQALNNEESVYQKTLLVDPMSDPEGKDGNAGHFGIIRGQWRPRCKYSLTNGTAVLLEYYRKNNLAGEIVSLQKELPLDVYQAAEAMSGESFGPEIILNGTMEEGTLPVKWEAGGATLSASPDSHSGKQSLKIAASIDFGRAVQSFAVRPNTRYRLDYWYKCSRPGGLYVYINAGGPNLVGDSKEDSVWTHLTKYFTTPNDPKITSAGIGFCSWPGKDTLIDDVSIREAKASNLLELRKVDAKFPDWSSPTFVLDIPAKVGNWSASDMQPLWRGPEKFSAVACLGWDSQGLRLAVKVKDVDHDQRYQGDAIWQGDSLQFGIDAVADGDKRLFGTGYDDVNDFVYGLALADRPGSVPELYRWNTPKTKPAGNILNDGKSHRYSVKVENGNALYDFFVAWDELGVAPKAGDKVGFNLVVFDSYKKESDKSDVLMWLELTPGIAGSAGQLPALWRKFVLTEP